MVARNLSKGNVQDFGTIYDSSLIRFHDRLRLSSFFRFVRLFFRLFVLLCLVHPFLVTILFIYMKIQTFSFL